MDSIFGHPAVPGVLATGAINAADSGNDDIEVFSSQGPVTNLFEGHRSKPDLAGIDGVHVTGAGGFFNPFYGTSAAAPTVAAAAADLRSAFPAKTGQEIANRLKFNAIDLGSGGYDTVFGWGRPDASNANTYSVPAGATEIVSSNPAGANIYIDGVSQGTTPKTITGVSWGRHTLWLNKTNFKDDYSSFSVGSTGTSGITRTLTAVAGSVTSGGTEVVGNSDNAMFSLWVSYQTFWNHMDFGDNLNGVALEPRASKGVSYAISAGDKLDGGKPAATKGKMAEYRYTTGGVPIGWASPGKVFSKPLRLSATPFSSPDYVLTGTTDPILFTGVGQGMDTPVPNVYYVKQEVTVSDRPVSAVGENRLYRIPITFTLTAL
ncbi:MAG: PEGA domain-containing protein [Methanoregula sp.]|nr:PEGA domain-containing protein [Methanoregula sp.]